MVELGKGLAAHLEVPLPYLLYRVNARFQEEIRGLKDIQDILSPTGGQPTFPSPLSAPEPTGPPASPRAADRPGPSALQRLQTKLSGSSRLSASLRLNTPLGVRARLNSLTNNVQAASPRRASASDNANANSATSASKKGSGISSSTLTLQADSKRSHQPVRNADPFSESSDEDDESDEELRKEEEADRAAEEQETLARRLEELQKMMTNEAIGLVSTARPRRRSLTERGRLGALSPRSVGSSYRGNGHDTLSSSSAANSASRSAGRGSGSQSQSLSEADSPQGSIPDIPSPQGSQTQSPRGQRLYSDGRTTASPGGRRGPLQNGNGHRYHVPSDDYGSSHGSETSSFTDLSGE